MKLKTITAILLGAAALAAAPVLPVTHGIWQDNAVVAEAADSLVTNTTVGETTYSLYRASNGVLHAEAINCYTNTTSLTLPASVYYGGKYYPITAVAPNAFSNRNNLTTVDLSQATNLTKIGENAFYLSSLTSLKTNSNLSIEKNALCGCIKLTSVDFGTASNIKISRMAINCCTALQSVTFSNANVSIYEQGFSQCDSLKKITFNSSVTSVWLESRALSGMKSLQTVCFNSSATELKMFSYAFAGTPLQSINFPSNITTIPAYCFYECKSLTNFTLPSQITSINAHAFEKANLSSTFTIPKNVSTIHDSAFAFTEGISNYTVASGNTKFKTINGALHSADGKRLISYPAAKTTASVTINAETIPDGTISMNPNITALNIPKYVRRSGDTSNFCGLTALRSIYLPSSEYNKSGAEIMTRFASLFEQNSKVVEINGNRIVQTPYNNYPRFWNKLQSYLEETFDKYEDKNCAFMSEFIDKFSSFVVNKVTTSSMSNVQKAVRLHQWILDYTTYDPDVKEYDRLKSEGKTPDEKLNDHRNHVWSSVFLFQKDIDNDGEKEHVSVCEGYAKCYEILMIKANIPTYYVKGENKDKKLSGHGWNLVYLDGSWYHVDVTWDDIQYDNNRKQNRYLNFLCGDNTFSNNGHGDFIWSLPENPDAAIRANNYYYDRLSNRFSYFANMEIPK